MKPRRTLSEPRTGVRTLRRLPTPLYDDRKARIRDRWLREAVDLAEEAILVDPYPLRADRLEIDGIVYDHATDGVAIAYEVIGDGVRFLSFADVWNRGPRSA